MKLIFLDFDGVLNSRQEQIWHYRTRPGEDFFLDFCPLACSNLAYLLEHDPELFIVVSSTWRIGRSLEYLQQVLEKNGIPGNRVIGKTPYEGDEAGRGRQIETWIKAHPELDIHSFVIIDDDSDMEPYADRLVKTLPGNGFMFYDMLQAAKLLGIEIRGMWL